MTEVMREEIRKNIQTFKVKAILEDVYYPIEIELNTGESQPTIVMTTINEAKKLMDQLTAEIEIAQWNEEIKPEPFETKEEAIKRNQKSWQESYDQFTKYHDKNNY